MAEHKRVGLRMTKREQLPAARAIVMRAIAIALALVTGGLFIRLLGHSPWVVYAGMLKGAFGTKISLRETIKLATPLCVCAIGLSLAFRMRFWNIGGEGQMCIGAIAATYFALFHADWPQAVLLPIMGISAILAGGLWGLIPAWFKARFNTNETLFTLMLNYIAMFVIQYLREGPWKNPKDMGYPKIAMVSANAVLPKVLGVHVGWIVALALVILAYLYVRHTKQGYELTVVGENPNTARYAGMPVGRIIMRTMFISAAICGLAGMLKASGADRTLTDAVAGGAGFTAITVSWLSGLNPFAIALVSLLFGVMEKGSSYIQSMYKISASAASVLQGILLFFVLGCEFFTQFRLIWHREGGERVG